MSDHKSEMYPPIQKQYESLKEIQERLLVISHLTEINMENTPNLLDIQHNIIGIRIELMKLAPFIRWEPAKNQSPNKD